MKIIKRNGSQEEFSVQKIQNSLAAASDVAKQPLNDSDIKQLLNSFHAIVEDKPSIQTAQITVIICGLLYVSGFHGVLKDYYEFGKRK